MAAGLYTMAVLQVLVGQEALLAPVRENMRVLPVAVALAAGGEATVPVLAIWVEEAPPQQVVLVGLAPLVIPMAVQVQLPLAARFLLAAVEAVLAGMQQAVPVVQHRAEYITLLQVLFL